MVRVNLEERILELEEDVEDARRNCSRAEREKKTAENALWAANVTIKRQERKLDSIRAALENN